MEKVIKISRSLLLFFPFFSLPAVSTEYRSRAELISRSKKKKKKKVEKEEEERRRNVRSRYGNFVRDNVGPHDGLNNSRVDNGWKASAFPSKLPIVFLIELLRGPPPFSIAPEQFFNTRLIFGGEFHSFDWFEARA